MTICKYLASFFVLLSCFLQSSAIQADPIVLNATSVYANYNHSDSYSVSGPGFSFTGSDRGDNLSAELEPGASFILEGAAIAGSYTGTFVTTPMLTGFVDINGVPMNALFQGFATTNSALVQFPDLTGPFPTTVSVPLIMQGSFMACLQRPLTGMNSPCDPAQLNVATVNVNLAGFYSFELNRYPADPPYPPYALSDLHESFAASGSPVPEPSTWTLLLAAAILGFLLTAAFAFINSPGQAVL